MFPPGSRPLRNKRQKEKSMEGRFKEEEGINSTEERIIDLIKMAIGDSISHIEDVKRYIEKLKTTLNDIACMSATITCPICGDVFKDMSPVIRRNIYINSWDAGSHSLTSIMAVMYGHDGYEAHPAMEGLCLKCGSFPIESSCLPKNPPHAWDRDVNPPGPRTKAWQILDEHPHINELWWNSFGGYTIRIKDRWYQGRFLHMNRSTV